MANWLLFKQSCQLACLQVHQCGTNLAVTGERTILLQFIHGLYFSLSLGTHRENLLHQWYIRNLERIHIEGKDKEFRNQVETKGKVSMCSIKWLAYDMISIREFLPIGFMRFIIYETVRGHATLLLHITYYIYSDCFE